MSEKDECSKSKETPEVQHNVDWGSSNGLRHAGKKRERIHVPTVACRQQNGFEQVMPHKKPQAHSRTVV